MKPEFCMALWLRLNALLFVLCIGLAGGESLAAELTGRVSVSGMLSETDSTGQVDTPGAYQQSLRLMWQENTGSNERWTFHAKTTHQYTKGSSLGAALHSSHLFRRKALSGDWFERSDHDSATRLSWEVDRALYEYNGDQLTLRIGRQAIDWGSGRFWQPLNVFGAFVPTTLDTEYKPGIDALLATWYPGEFSSVTGALVFSPTSADTDYSAALHYRNRVTDQAELALLAGRVLGNNVFGAALESEWRGMGWRLEASYQDISPDDAGLFVIGGVDYKFDNGTMVTAEWYENAFGAASASALTAVTNHPLSQRGLLPHLSKRVFTVSAGREIMPLLNGQYTILASRLEGENNTGGQETSLLHQLNLTYSLTDESELLFSLSASNGKGLDSQGRLQSEFGHFPASVVLQYRGYF